MIKYVRIQNFKAIRDSGKIKFQDLNVFIGNNGTGKSSVIEALQLLQDLVFSNDFTEVFRKWGGFEKIRNQYSNIEQSKTNHIGKMNLKKNKLGIERTHLPISIEISAKIENKNFKYEVHLNTSVDGNFYQNEFECLTVGKEIIYEDAPSFLTGKKELDGWSFFNTEILELKQKENPFCFILLNYISNWQFLNLNAHLIGLPLQVNKSQNKKKLKSDGSNLSEIIKQEFKTREELSIVLEKLKYVLPYVTDIHTSVSTEIADTIFLEMTESAQFKLPGWLFSSGTVRVLAMLVALNKKNPPSVLFIEEIENGLDPRTVNMLLSEIQASLDTTQFVVTTHSPYFLDLLDLSHIVLVEKNAESGTTFERPNNDDTLKGWKDKFSPGQLYLMDRMGKKMKLGIICEGGKQGADYQTYPFLIRKICDTIEIEVVPLDEKPKLIEKCATTAKALLEHSNCDKVLILWDLMPRWGGRPCRKDDTDSIKENLKKEGIPDSKVKLVSIEPELEAIFLADGRVLSSYKSQKSHPHRVIPMKDTLLKNNSKDAKTKISKYLERKYNDIQEALAIAKHITSIDRIVKSIESVARLESFIKEICN